MPAPTPAPLPLTRWQQTWRLLVVSVLGLFLWFAQFSITPEPVPWLPLVDLVLGAGAVVLVCWRRRRPLLVAVIAVAATGLSGMALPAAFLALVSLTTTRRWRAVALVVGIGTLAVPVYDVVDPASAGEVPWWALMLTAVVAWGLAVGVGVFVSTRRALVLSYRDRAETAEREQRARVEQARLGERTRIAREMHDVLAHRISLLAMHAGAMTYREDLSRDELRSAAQVVQDNARQALADLRDVLGVLRDPAVSVGPPGTDPEPPQPTLDQLDALLTETRHAGHPVELVDARQQAEALPPTVGRTAYRIVQEGLTNARKHAPGAPVRVRLDGAPGGRLGIDLSNPVPARTPELGHPGARLPSSGVGLVGLAERTSLAGGRLSYGVTDEGCYRVHVDLPWPDLAVPA